MKLLSKIRFFFNKPPVAVVPPDLQSVKNWLLLLIEESVFFSGGNIPHKKKIIIENNDSFLIKHSLSPVLVAKGAVDKELLAQFHHHGIVIADREALRLIDDDKVRVESVGTEERFTFWASDIDREDGTVFKINYGGDCIPFWIKKSLSEDEIIDLMLALRVAISLGLNLVEASQKLKEFDLQKT